MVLLSARMRSCHTWQCKGKHKGKGEAGGAGEENAPAPGQLSTHWELQFAPAPPQSLWAQKQEQFACLNKSASWGQALSRAQLTWLAEAPWACVSPTNQGQGLVCRTRAWGRSWEVTGQEKQTDNKTLGLSFASLLNVSSPNLAEAKPEQTLETQENSLQCQMMTFVWVGYVTVRGT